MADWKDVNLPHKKCCKMYRDNVAPDNRPEGNGQKGAVAIGLLSILLIEEETCRKAMIDRSDAFLEEAKRCLDIYLKNDEHGFRKATIGLSAALVYNMGKVRLQCAATLHDSENEVGFGGGGTTTTVNHVIFEVVEEGGEDVQIRLHPPCGSGDVSFECRERVVKKLKAFFARANDKYGISIQSFTYGRGLMWISEEDFRDDKKEFEGLNGGNMIIWMPDMGHVMEDTKKAATGGLWGVE